MPVCIDESSLCDLIRYQDRDAFTYLYDAYSPAVFGEILRIVKNRESAEDLLQEVFITIWQKGHQYDSRKGRLFTWMLSITRNRCIDHLRRAENKPGIFRTDNSFTRYEVHEERSELEFSIMYKNVKNLESTPTELIRLVYIYGFTHTEAAKKCEIPVGTVKTILRKFIIKTREKYLAG